ncbi:hypothetical protein LX32DRAFT_702601 [Colletotrichum zoysiae]|uniref:Uncharacterized protein n=1 Tax=Colletotrichum zoysiae TaxID=1216348 RepID=A0AAD9HBM7_9PEZI|nr:hypothetical protein LX32DRAFT_702601 [Colletotrichum zoysiae]
MLNHSRFLLGVWSAPDAILQVNVDAAYLWWKNLGVVDITEIADVKLEAALLIDRTLHVEKQDMVFYELELGAKYYSPPLIVLDLTNPLFADFTHHNANRPPKIAAGAVSKKIRQRQPIAPGTETLEALWIYLGCLSSKFGWSAQLEEMKAAINHVSKGGGGALVDMAAPSSSSRAGFKPARLDLVGHEEEDGKPQVPVRVVEACQNIIHDGFSMNGHPSTLIGQPMALVNVSLSLELATPVMRTHSYADIRKCSDIELNNYKFKVMQGHNSNLCDRLVSATILGAIIDTYQPVHITTGILSPHDVKASATWLDPLLRDPDSSEGTALAEYPVPLGLYMVLEGLYKFSLNSMEEYGRFMPGKREDDGGLGAQRVCQLVEDKEKRKVGDLQPL